MFMIYYTVSTMLTTTAFTMSPIFPSLPKAPCDEGFYSSLVVCTFIIGSYYFFAS